jgi:hypothetical protein
VRGDKRTYNNIKIRACTISAGEKIVSALLAAGANINTEDKEGKNNFVFM